MKILQLMMELPLLLLSRLPSNPLVVELSLVLILSVLRLLALANLRLIFSLKWDFFLALNVALVVLMQCLLNLKVRIINHLLGPGEFLLPINPSVIFTLAAETLNGNKWLLKAKLILSQTLLVD